jgi:hypothetical protein
LVVIGWDVSTAAIGICLKRDGEEHSFSVIFPRGGSPLEKWRSAVEGVRIFMASRQRDGSVHHIIEQRLGGFTGGLTTKQTLMALAAMNAVVSHELSDTGTVTYILPVTAKRIVGFDKLRLDGEDKKEAVVRLARSSCPRFPYREKKAGRGKGKGKTYPWVKGVDDMADAWLLVEAGTKVLKGEASIGQSKKAPGRKGSSRRAKAGSQEEE